MMEAVERPKTGRGFRQRISYTNAGREDVFDESKTGRPTSRMGFRPDTYDRHDYDEFSRQEPPAHSPDYSPRGGYNSPQVVSSPLGYRQCSPSHQMTVSPNEEYLSAQSPSAYRSLSREMMHRQGPAYSSSYEHVSNKHSISQHSPFQGELDDGQIFDFEPPSYESSQGHYPTYEENRPVTRDYNRSSPEGMQPAHVPIMSGKNRYQYDNYRHGDEHNRHVDRYDQHIDQHADKYYQHSDQHYQHGEKHYQHGDQNYQHVESNIESEVMPVHEEVRPTSSRPRSSRPKSARRRPQSGRKQKKEYLHDQETVANQESDAAVTVRPHSSFLRFKPLPAIGSNGKMTDQERANELAEQTKQLHIKERSADTSGSTLGLPQSSAVGLAHSYSPIKDKTLENRALYPNESDGQSDEDDTSKTKLVDSSELIFTPHKLPEEPSGDEMRLLLAIKLPDGKRIQRHFRLTDTLYIVKQFTENMACLDLSEYQLSCNSPKVVFKDLSQMLGEAGLADRTLLFMTNFS